MKVLYKLVLIIILTTELATPVTAQNKIIEVDSVSGLPSQALPFDEPFVLKIPTRSTRVKGVAYLQHVGRQNFGDSYRYRESIKDEQGWIKDLKLVNFDPNEFEVRKVGTQNYLLIHITNPKLLDPGKIYTFFWAEEVSDDVIKMFDLYHNNRLSGDSDALREARKIYKQVAKEIQDRFNYPLNFTSTPADTVNLTRVREIYTDLDLKLRNSYATLKAKEDNFGTVVNEITTLTTVSEAKSLTVLAQKIVERTTDFDYELRQKYLPSEAKATNRLYRLSQLKDDADARRRLLKGEDDIDCNNCKPTPATQYETRRANLKTTLGAVDELLLVADLTARSGSVTLQKAATTLRELQTDLRTLLNKFDEVVAARKEIKNKIFNQAVSKLTTLGGSTFTYSFETRNKLSIAPDFGVVTTRIGSDGSNPYAFVPYLGFHINFRPINRDVPFKSYDHRVGHRFSLMFGWSIVSVDNGPKLSPGADSVSSFFSKGKGTLLTGLGFRLGNAMRITGGYVWHFSYPASDTNPPVYNRRQLQTWPFIGLSLDLSLKDLLNGITDVFQGTPRRFTPAAPISTAAPAAN